MLVFAPLFFGGNRPLPLMVLEVLALSILAGVYVRPVFAQHLNKPFLVLLGLMVVLPLLQLLPLPFSFWSSLSAYSSYADAMRSANIPPAAFRSLSLVPSLTESSWLALLPALAVFLFAVGLSTERLRSVVTIFLIVAALEAFLALAQYGAGTMSRGSYASRDHLAGMMEMALPISLALLAASLGHAEEYVGQRSSMRHTILSWLNTYCNRSAIYAILSIGLLLALIFSRSRTGVGLAAGILLLSALAYSTRLGSRNVYGLMGTVTALGISLAVAIGLVPVLNRFALEDPLKDARWTIYAATLSAIQEFMPFGSGIGTFGQAFQRFQPSELSGYFINRAHNDYLEWVMEGGILALLIILGLLFFYFKRLLELLTQSGYWSHFKFIQVGAGIGMLIIALHSLVDFNLHIPANQIYFALLAALLFHRTTDSVTELNSHDHARHRLHNTPKMEQVKMQIPSFQATPKIQPGKNPFAED
jgi:O-antigen ligase